MAQVHEHHTHQLYQEYHQCVHTTEEVQTYMHFGAVSRTNAASQTELLTGYMKAMIEAINHDINHLGECWLVQAILGHELPAIHVLDYSALVHVHTSLFSPIGRGGGFLPQRAKGRSQQKRKQQKQSKQAFHGAYLPGIWCFDTGAFRRSSGNHRHRGSEGTAFSPSSASSPFFMR